MKAANEKQRPRRGEPGTNRGWIERAREMGMIEGGREFRATQTLFRFISRSVAESYCADSPIFPSFYCDCGRFSADFRLSFIYVSGLSFFDRAIIVFIDPRASMLFFLLRFKEEGERIGEKGLEKLVRRFDQVLGFKSCFFFLS